MALYAKPLRWCYSEATADPEPSRDADLAGHITLVQATGLTTPKAWCELHERRGVLSTRLADPLAATRRLIGAVVDGDGDIPTALGLASTKPDPMVVETVHQHVGAKLRELWPARRNYMLLAGQFDGAARRFADLARTVDVEADPAVAIRLGRNEQKAWHAAPELAATLDDLAARCPAVSFARGSIRVDDPGVAVVGSRKASPRGILVQALLPLTC